MKKVYLEPEIVISDLGAKDVIMYSVEWETSENEGGIF